MDPGCSFQRYFQGGSTGRRVQQKLVAALQDQQQGLPAIGERQTVRQFLERWLEESARPGVRPATYDSYSDLVRLHIIPELDGCRWVGLLHKMSKP